MNLCIQEMNANEMNKIDGGIWPYIIGAIIGELLDRNSGADFAEGFNATR